MKKLLLISLAFSELIHAPSILQKSRNYTTPKKTPAPEGFVSIEHYNAMVHNFGLEYTKDLADGNPVPNLNNAQFDKYLEKKGILSEKSLLSFESTQSGIVKRAATQREIKKLEEQNKKESSKKTEKRIKELRDSLPVTPLTIEWLKNHIIEFVMHYPLQIPILPKWLEDVQDAQTGQKLFTNYTFEHAKKYLNEDAAKYQRADDDDTLASTDQNFIDKHYPAIADQVAQKLGGYHYYNNKEINNLIASHIEGKYLFLDATNMNDIANYLLQEKAPFAVTHISVHATDIGNYNQQHFNFFIGKAWKTIDTIFKQRPELTLVVNFDNNSQTDRFKVPNSVQILVTAGHALTSIENKFLSLCTNLESLDLSAFKNATSVKYDFLSNCSGLRKLNLSPLKNVISIGGFFLSHCSGLKKLDLSPLKKLTSTGHSFLYQCSGLISLDLSPLRYVTSVENSFLSHCSGLTSLDLSSLKYVTSLGDAFLSNCSELKSLDLSPLKKVVSIGTYFLSNCTKLTDLKLPPNLTDIKKRFLSNCDNLKTLYLNEKLSKDPLLSDRIPYIKNVIFYNEEEKSTTSLVINGSETEKENFHTRNTTAITAAASQPQQSTTKNKSLAAAASAQH